MLSWVLKFELDLVLFTLIAAAVTVAAHVWLKRRDPRGLPGMWRAAVTCVVAVTILRAMVAGEEECDRLRDRLEGIAPTYAQDIGLLGHSKIHLDTPETDPVYQSLIQAQVRWQRVNRSVSDIYTFRRTPEGKVVFVVDSETDYDRDNKIDHDRETRTPVGEEFPDPTPAALAALDGHASFEDEPYADRWGTWVSAYVPIYTADGKIDGALGVDYDASLWNNDVARARGATLGFGALTGVVVLASGVIVTFTRIEADQRQRLQRKLVDASRQAGMAEMATGVLHNVGNVLNSVNVSATVLAEKVRHSKLPGLGKAAEMLQQHRDDIAQFVSADNKGKLLPDYLVKLSGLLSGEQDELLREIDQLSRNIGHVKQIVSAQQGMAKSVTVSEEFVVDEMLDDAIALASGDIKAAGADVYRTRDPAFCLTTDRNAVLQIIVNMLSNAAKAVRECEKRQITIDVRPAPETGAAGLDIAVVDTGVGISPEVMAQLFRHGFTTRPDGHGFGLHHAANTAHAMGGKLVAASDGVGHGATFTLTLPLHSHKGEPCPA